MAEPRLISVIRQLADLEAREHLTEAEMSELNGLRIELGDRWPAVGLAVAHAYVTAGCQQATP